MKIINFFSQFNGRTAVLLGLIVLGCLLAGMPFLTQAGTVNLEVGIGTNTTTEGISFYIGMIYRFAAAIVGVIAVIMIIIGGIQYSASAGNPAALGSAKETITSAIIGLVIVLMSYLILGVFSSRFTNLSEPVLDPVDIPATDKPANDPTGANCPGTSMTDARTNLDLDETCTSICRFGKYSAKSYKPNVNTVCCICTAGGTCPGGYIYSQDRSQCDMFCRQNLNIGVEDYKANCCKCRSCPAGSRRISDLGGQSCSQACGTLGVAQETAECCTCNAESQLPCQIDGAYYCNADKKSVDSFCQTSFSPDQNCRVSQEGSQWCCRP